jgi:hypothetical protein
LESVIPKKIPIPCKEIRLKTAQRFHQVTDFPNYIGAVDGKHIRILCPPSSGLHYFNYKIYRQILFYAHIMFLKNLHKLKSHKSNTKFLFKTVYFLGVRELKTSPYILYDYTNSGYTDLYILQ